MRWNSILRMLLFIAVIVAFGLTVTALLSAETPYGRISGVLKIEENDSVLPDTEVSLIDDETFNVIARTVTDSEGRFNFSRVAIGRYHLFTETEAHEQPKITINVMDTETSTLTLTLKPSEPFLRVFEGQRLYTTKEEATMRCHGFLEAEEMSVKVYRIDDETAIDSWNGWLPEAIGAKGNNFRDMDVEENSKLTLIKSWQQSIAKRDREGVFRARIKMGKLPAGLYLIDVKSANLHAKGAIAVSDIGVVVKGVPDKLLAYTVSLLDGKALSGVSLQVRNKGSVIARGKSDARGLLNIALPASTDGRQVAVVARQGKNVAVADLYLYSYNDNKQLRVFTFTDRPVYRPGHTVNFKVVCRKMKDKLNFSVPDGKSAQVKITDNKENVVYHDTLQSNEYGSLFGTFELSENALPGYYSIETTIDGVEYYGNFSVAEYRKPEFEVRINTPRERYIYGDSLTAQVSAQYYFGAPVANSKVEYTVTREQSWFIPEYDYWNSDIPGNTADNSGADYYDGGEVVASGEGKTDENGFFDIAFATMNEGTKKSSNDTTDWQYIIKATVEDVGKRTAGGSKAISVTQGDIRLQARAAAYLSQPGKSVRIDVDVRDYAGKSIPSWGGSAEVFRVEWQKDNKAKYFREAIYRWWSDNDGMAEFTIVPQREGDYLVRVYAKDRRGRKVGTECSLWVMKDDEGYFHFPYGDLDVRADKPYYQAGETAEVVINTRFAPTEALLTLEGDTLLEYRMISLKAKSTVIKVPVAAANMPNFSVNVCLVDDKQLISGEASINISRAPKALQITITPDQQKYQPGEEAVFQLQSRTVEGQPIAAELSFALVDEAVFAIRADDTENIVAFFYPRRWNSVQTTFSFPSIYLSGDDKAGSSIRTRRLFPDTAAWHPSVVTDSDGKATVKVKMPDSLTTWRATCRAATLDTRVGQATAKIQVQKPFMLRLETPRFMTQGDEAEIAVIAHNLSDRPLEVEIGLEGTGIKISNRLHEKFELQQGESRRFTGRINADKLGNAEMRAWGRAEGMSEVNYSDAIALSFPVIVKGRRMLDVRAGSLPGDEELVFPAGKKVVPGSRQLTIRLAPSLAAVMLGSLDYLAKYPYGCTEQILSCFLPDVVLYQWLQESGTVDAKKAAELKKMVDSGLLQLYAQQHYDGGWGWWANDSSDPWMTAYVVFGLLRTQQAGIAINNSVLNNGISALLVQSREKKFKDFLSAQAFMAYSLAKTGRVRETMDILERCQAGDSGKLLSHDNWARVMLALAAYHIGEKQTADNLINAVWEVYEQGNLSDKYNQYYYYSSTDIAAVLLFATSEMDATDTRLEGLVRWLLARRQDNHWYSTRDTAFAIYGLAAIVAQTGELHPDINAEVLVDGKSVLQRTFTSADINKPEYLLTIDPGQQSGKPITVEMKANGTGKVYYSVMLEHVTAADLTKPAYGEAGLQISRAYRKVARNARNVDGKPLKTSPQSSFNTGDLVQITLSVNTAHPYEYLLLEDPLPGGLEAIDRGEMDYWDWNYWWSNKIIRDKMVSFPVRYFEKGQREITYLTTAMTPGKFTALPAKVYDMYQPNSWADSPIQTITVRD